MGLTGKRDRDEDFDEVPGTPPPRAVPWTIWVVVCMLGLEGLGNLSQIPYMPRAADWFAFKCLAIVGLIRGWRWVYVLTVVVAGVHILGFGMQAPFVAFLNLVIVLLVATSFPRSLAKAPLDGSPDVLKPQVREVSGWEGDA